MKAAIRGGRVCGTHGGGSEIVKASARARLEALIDPAIKTLSDCMKDAEKTKEPETRRIALSAAKTVLDRTGYAAVSNALYLKVLADLRKENAMKWDDEGNQLPDTADLSIAPNHY